MLAQQFQFGGKRADGRLHAVAFREPAARRFHQYVEYLLLLSGTQSAILGAVVVELLEALLHSLGGADVEQGLAVLTLRRAGMNLKFYSVCLARHNLSGLLTVCFDVMFCKVNHFYQEDRRPLGVFCYFCRKM